MMSKLGERAAMASDIATGFQAIPVLFENDDLIAVDKPEKLASIPERNREKVCLLKILSETLERKLYTVHRLDKQVSGVILFAKTPAAHRQLNLMFEHRQVQKTYMALVHGEIAGERGVIDKPLRCFGSGRMGEDVEQGKPCVTEFTVEERFAGCTRVKVSPLTGRKHQIRAHFFAIGHPIVGDTLYGDKSLQKTFPRLMLHALSIRLLLAPGGQEVAVTSEIPVSFSEVLRSIRHPGR
jgi:tRNA pseudouridine32 synthase / 23S rRNA pseudouridine746 synthase